MKNMMIQNQNTVERQTLINGVASDLMSHICF